MSQIDIIGDIHGHATLLKSVLKQLGYSKTKSGAWRHPDRQLIFCGDILNRGPEVKKTVKIVRNMVDDGSAEMILGNHEYDFIAYHRRDLAGKPLLLKNRKSILRLRGSLEAFSRKRDQDELISWLQSRPLYIQTPNLRVAHACWQKSEIKYLKKHYPNRLSEELLLRSAEPFSDEYWAVHTLLDGPKIVQYSEEDVHVDVRSRTRSFVKTMWWNVHDQQKIKKVSLRGHRRLSSKSLPVDYSKIFRSYPVTARPLFFGHYCLTTSPRLISNNLCCLDYCVLKSKKLTVYRYDGEAELDHSKLLHLG